MYFEVYHEQLFKEVLSEFWARNSSQLDQLQFLQLANLINDY